MPRRGENIRKRKDGRWEARYPSGTDENGKKIYTSVYAESYREVKEKRNIAIQQMHMPSNERVVDLQFKDILHLWLENNKIRLKESTVYRYSYLIESHILPELGNLWINSMDSSTINSFLANKARCGRLDGQGGLSASYTRSIMLIINSALRFAVDNKICGPVCGRISKPPIKPQELSVLSISDQEKLENILLNNMDETKLGIYISLYTGLRIGEICALSWEDIDLSNRLMHVRHTVVRVRHENNGRLMTKQIIDEPKTKTSLRKIPLNSDLMSILSRMAPKATSKYVVSKCADFVSPRTYEYRYCRVLQICGISHINYHALRHTFATRCIEAGVDVKTLSEILGHSNVSITLNTYVHSSMELKRSQLEKLVASPV